MSVLRVEQQRQILEQTLLDLRQKLKHWHTLDAEYEGLKEELEAEPTVPDAAGLERIAQTYNADLVDVAEIRKLTGIDTGNPRSPSEITRTIQHRQDYVQSSIDSLQRRFFEAEAKLEEFDFAASRDVNTGLPLTEIHEELDDDDNVISSSLSQPETAQTQLIDSLRKAGLSDEDIYEAAAEPSLKSAIVNANPLTPPASVKEEDPHLPVRKKSVSFSADTKEPNELVRTDSDEGRKSVSFATKVAIAPAAPVVEARSVSFSPKVEEIPSTFADGASSDTQQNKPDEADSAIQRDLRASFKPGDRVIKLNDDDEVASEHVVIPENESAEDAQLRREMLDYHLNEVGHVVAQLDFDDGYGDDDDDDDDTSSHHTSSTRYEDEDTPYTSNHSDEDEDDDYEEDDYGRSKRSVITEEYRQKMLELQSRLIGNLGPSPKDEDIADADPALDPKDIRRLVVLGKDDSDTIPEADSSDKKANSKKRVSFAESVDFEGERNMPGPPPLKAPKQEADENTPAFTGSIAERLSSTENGNADTENSSRPEYPSGPADKILADTLIERPAAQSPKAIPDHDEDPVMQRRELAAEYYRRRNDIIRQQGGFKKDEDEEVLGELMEERDGKAKKVSRFKAARIKG